MSKPEIKEWPALRERYEAPAEWYATTEDEPNGEIRVMFMLQSPELTFACFGSGTLIDLRLNRYSRALLHQSIAFQGPLEPDGLPPSPAVESLCNDCAFLDHCPDEGECIRAAMQRLGIHANTPADEVRAMIRNADTAIVTVDSGMSAMAPSAIIEPPSADELKGIHWPTPAEMRKRPWIPNDSPANPTRAQVRAAIDEISKAQLQITPGLKNVYGMEIRNAREVADEARVAANVLEALPEAVAHAFGLTIRGACSFCCTTIFTADPKATDAEGRDVCEAHA